MTNQENIFLYNRRYNLNLKETFESYNSEFKAKVLLAISKNRFTSKFLHVFDIVTFKEKIHNGIYSYNKKFKLRDENSKSYKKIQLLELNYFEALEIDDFDKYKDKITSKFSNKPLFYSSRSKSELKEKLANIKKNLDAISWGILFYINFEENRKINNDLISSVDVSYIKTNESYFILNIKILPSEKFKKIFSKIIENTDIMLSKQHYHTYIDILKLKRFQSHQTVSLSSKSLNIDNLLSDLNQQVKKNITKHFKGYFHNSKIDFSLPLIEYYEVEDFIDFHNDLSLKQNFNTGTDGHYSIDDNQIEIYFTNSNKRSTRIQVIKQKGHGNTVQNGKDHTDYDLLETHYLLNSLAFPCVFRGILNELFEKLNSLKRDIYDFGNDTKNINIFKSLFFFKYNNSYLKLKQTLVQILITTKRFENEFTKDNLALYTSEFELNDFTPRNYKRKIEKKNLLFDIVEEFSASIISLKDKTISTNEIFKSIEELNTYRTSYLLQIISLFIAILAFIFAFDKAKDFSLYIFHLIIK